MTDSFERRYQQMIERLLVAAAKDGNFHTVETLLGEGPSEHARNLALCAAAGKGQTEIAGLLLKEGANIHYAQDESLQLAAMRGHVETVRLLLREGADHTRRDSAAIGLAVDHGHVDCVTLLRAAGASLQGERPSRMTPEMMAALDAPLIRTEFTQSRDSHSVCATGPRWSAEDRKLPSAKPRQP
jgi:hypothetical protein